MSYIDEGDISGDLSIDEWNSNVTGHYKPVGCLEYELSALSLERVSNLSKRATLLRPSLLALNAPSSLKVSAFLMFPEGRLLVPCICIYIYISWGVELSMEQV